MDLNTFEMIANAFNNSVKAILEFRNKKEYENFMNPYREDFKKMIEGYFKSLEDKTFSFEQYTNDLAKEIGGLKIGRFLDIMVILGLVSIRHTGSGLMINPSHKELYPIDKQVLINEIDKCKYDPYFITL